MLDPIGGHLRLREFFIRYLDTAYRIRHSDARFSTFSRTGVRARTSAGVYTTEEPARDHLGLALLLDPPPMLRPPPLLTDEDGDEYGA